MTLEETLFHFLEENYDRSLPVLLGLSGGADSLALFYLLEGYKLHRPFHFGIAHVDHGWRSESIKEAEHLRQLAAQTNVPFHLKILHPAQMSGNLEEACRHERLAFFTHLCREHGYQAVLLGHHANDQSETVLKKVLEGSSLPYLSGMSSISKYQGLFIWRPLLNCSKGDIKQWLDQKRHVSFEDKSNFDEKFLRARFRTKIMPELSQSFGKEIAPSLCRISREAEELKGYLDAQLENYTKSIEKGPFGSCLDFETHSPKFDMEIRYLIRKVCEKEGIQLSHHLIEDICRKIRSKAPNCNILKKTKSQSSIYLDRGRLFVMKRPFPEFNQNMALELGRYSLAGWNIMVNEVGSEGNELPVTGWKEAWMGRMQIQMPPGQYFLSSGNASLSKWWTNAKVPSFMRRAFPVLWSENGILHEFLTKRRFSKNRFHNDKLWTIEISVGEI